MKNVVLYHDNCVDGFTSYYIAQLHLDNCVGIPVRYGEPPPIEQISKQDNVYILDFSYKKDVLEDIASRCNRLVVIDHHKTAEEELKKASNYEVIFNLEKSGAKLTAEAFGYNHYLVDYVQDRDLWQWRLPASKYVNCFLQYTPKTVYEYSQIFQMKLSEVQTIGLYLKMMENYYIDIYLSQAFMYPLEDQIHAAVYCPIKELTSELGHLLSKRSPSKIGIVFCGDHASLRSEGDIDVSKIAVKYNGGGHKNAAGFNVKQLHK